MSAEGSSSLVESPHYVRACIHVNVFSLTVCGVVQLYRRYGARRASMSHPIPVQPGSMAAPEGPSRAAGQPVGASPDSTVAGKSPESDVSASQHSGHSGSARIVRLYPDEDLMAQPLEPGTPSTESTVATQQLWDALSRGRASAYRVSLHSAVPFLLPPLCSLRSGLGIARFASIDCWHTLFCACLQGEGVCCMSSACWA